MTNIPHQSVITNFVYLLLIRLKQYIIIVKINLTNLNSCSVFPCPSLQIKECRNELYVCDPIENKTKNMFHFIYKWFPASLLI